MHKKSSLFLLLSLILVFSLSSNISVQNASAQSIVNQANSAVIGIQLDLKPANQNYYSQVNSSLVAQIQNETAARFIASFVNLEAEVATLNTFRILFYNQTDSTNAAQTLTLSYVTSNPSKIELQPNNSYTEVYDNIIPFPQLDKGFSVRYQFQYTLASNTSNVLEANSAFNYSVYSQLPLYSPPDFIIWTWWGINGIIALHFLVGWYGNRKTNKQKASE